MGMSSDSLQQTWSIYPDNLSRAGLMWFNFCMTPAGTQRGSMQEVTVADNHQHADQPPELT